MLINIDWLQLHCHGVISENKKYVLKQLNYSTRTFKTIHDVFLNGEYIASIVSDPVSKIINPKTVIVKIINKQLYSPYLKSLVMSLIEDFNLYFIGITRLDICSDFNYFKNGKYPETLINDFMTLKIRKVGQTKGKCHFEQKKSMHYETLSFGTHNSVIRCYLYNKTKELNDVKMKPYIIDNWKASGLDINKNVWRLEFSIKGNSLKLVDESSGVIEKLTLDNIFDRQFLTNLFYSLQYSYFRFKQPTGDKNISRCPDVELFQNYPFTWKRLFINESTDGTRADKIFIRKLDDLNNEIRSYAKYRDEFLQELTAEFVTEKGLQDYYLHKIAGKSTNLINYLKEEQFTMYEDLKRRDVLKEQDKELFDDETVKEKIKKIVLSNKKI